MFPELLKLACAMRFAREGSIHTTLCAQDLMFGAGEPAPAGPAEEVSESEDDASDNESLEDAVVDDGEEDPCGNDAAPEGGEEGLESPPAEEVCADTPPEEGVFGPPTPPPPENGSHGPATMPPEDPIGSPTSGGFFGSVAAAPPVCGPPIPAPKHGPATRHSEDPVPLFGPDENGIRCPLIPAIEDASHGPATVPSKDPIRGPPIPTREVPIVAPVEVSSSSAGRFRDAAQTILANPRRDVKETAQRLQHLKQL